MIELIKYNKIITTLSYQKTIPDGVDVGNGVRNYIEYLYDILQHTKNISQQLHCFVILDKI